MSRILLDENLPVALRHLLVGHDVRTVRDLGWVGVGNGALLSRAEEADFEVLLTGDKNLRYQQNLTGRRIGLVILSSSQWQTVRMGAERIRHVLETMTEGGYREVVLDRPRLRRRPPPDRR